MCAAMNAAIRVQARTGAQASHMTGQAHIQTRAHQEAIALAQAAAAWAAEASEVVAVQAAAWVADPTAAVQVAAAVDADSRLPTVSVTASNPFKKSL